MGRRALGTTMVSVMHAIANGVRYGFDIMDDTGLPSGTVYPALSRLERYGLVRGRWERAAIAQSARRPPRRYYELTGAGRRRLDEEVARIRALSRSLRPIGGQRRVAAP